MTPKDIVTSTPAADMPRRRASRPLVDVIGPMTDEQAAKAIAIFNRYLYAPETAQAETPDAA